MAGPLTQPLFMARPFKKVTFFATFIKKKSEPQYVGEKRAKKANLIIPLGEMENEPTSHQHHSVVNQILINQTELIHSLHLFKHN